MEPYGRYKYIFHVGSLSDTCRNTTHMSIMDRGFSVFKIRKIINRFSG